MRISKINVKNLFGIFNHEIDMNNRDRVTIIHAPNGYGKTTILKMINIVFKNELLSFHDIYFDEFKIFFNNEIVLNIIKQKNHIQKLKYIIKDKKNKRKHAVQIPLESKYQENLINTEIPYIERIDRDLWYNRKTGEKINFKKVNNILSKEKLYSRENNKRPEWFINIIKKLEKLPVRLVESQRLLQFDSDHENQYYSESEERKSLRNNSTKSSVKLYSEEIKEIIESKLAESTSLSQELDRTFPFRIIKRINNLNDNSILSVSQIKKKLKKLEKKREKLEKVGLLYKSDNLSFNNEYNFEDMNKQMRRILTLYLQDASKKLEIFNDLQKKIELMKTIINRRFQNKVLEINRKEGIIFKLKNGDLLNPEKLSSGEQHEIILIFEMLFKSAPHSLILIDEPEISLHISWQQYFLNDLMEITQLTDIDILIATHSPQIIHDRWDLAVALENEGNDN